VHQYHGHRSSSGIRNLTHIAARLQPGPGGNPNVRPGSQQHLHPEWLPNRTEIQHLHSLRYLACKNATTLYVADEGRGHYTYSATPLPFGIYTMAAAQKTAGLQKWILVSGTWKLTYTLQAGLALETS
jgi:hypothetical protein